MRSVFAGVAALGFAVASIAAPASASEVGRSHFQFASDLALDGFEPFASSSTGKAIFGMKKGSTLYLCFMADTPEFALERREKLLVELAGTPTDREVPNIAVVCVLVQ